MKLCLSFAVVLASLFVAKSSHCEIIDNPKEILARVSAKVPGAWLDTEALKKCLAADIEREKLSGIVVNLVATNESLTRSNKTLGDNNGLLLDEKATWELQTRDAEKLAGRLEDELKLWYHNPYIMGALGVAAGVLATSIVVVSIHR